jgi:hypothetical protein
MYAVAVPEKSPERASEDPNDTEATGRTVENGLHGRRDQSEKRIWRCGAKICVSAWPDDLRWSERSGDRGGRIFPGNDGGSLSVRK